MPKKLVSKIRLEVNGTEITDFQKFKEGKVTKRQQVKLMNGVGVTDVTPQRTVSVDFLIPSGEKEFDYESVENGTLTIDKLDGNRITFTGVTFLERGDVDFGDKEAVPAVTFHVDDKKEN